MARPGQTSRGQLHVGRYLGVLAAIFAILYSTVIFAGSGSSWLKPKLGLDLQGGAQVILTPEAEGGKKPNPAQLAAAVDILRQRVNGAGVSEAEVVIEGDQIVVQVPGGNRESIATVTKAAQLQFRRVVELQGVQQPVTTPTSTKEAAARSPARTASRERSLPGTLTAPRAWPPGPRPPPARSPPWARTGTAPRTPRASSGGRRCARPPRCCTRRRPTSRRS